MIPHPLVLNSAQIPHQLILSSSPVHSAPKRLSSDARSDFNSLVFAGVGLWRAVWEAGREAIVACKFSLRPWQAPFDTNRNGLPKGEP